MGQLLYNTLSVLGQLTLRPLQWVGSRKLREFWVGRTETWARLQALDPMNDKRLWMHCASLGEFEQGRPILEWLRKQYPEHQIVLSFFSPSGYGPKKNTPLADVVVYLPWDQPSNARKFVQTVAPGAAFMVKSDLWPNYLIALEQRQIPCYVIAARFKPKHWIFGPAGQFMRHRLRKIRHVFVQNQDSFTLLKQRAIDHCSVSGDPRYDRVTAQLSQDNELDFIDAFKQKGPCIILGSSWPEDHDLWLPAINQFTELGVQFIIAPHDLNPDEIKRLSGKITADCLIYQGEPDVINNRAQVLIVNTIGHLSRIYAHGDLAYVGGGMGHSGLHNILEPAAFGLPIMIGPVFSKFPEAIDLIERGGVLVIKRPTDVIDHLEKFLDDDQLYSQMGAINSNYIQDMSGATARITEFLKEDLYL